MIPADARGAWREIEKRLRPYVARRVGSTSEIDDIVQDILVKTLGGLGTAARPSPNCRLAIPISRGPSSRFRPARRSHEASWPRWFRTVGHSAVLARPPRAVQPSRQSVPESSPVAPRAQDPLAAAQTRHPRARSRSRSGCPDRLAGHGGSYRIGRPFAGRPSLRDPELHQQGRRRADGAEHADSNERLLHVARRYGRQVKERSAGGAAGVGARRVTVICAPPAGVRPRSAKVPNTPASGEDTIPNART
jgi:hypothetical protein